jgi:hypothetical protein
MVPNVLLGSWQQAGGDHMKRTNFSYRIGIAAALGVALFGMRTARAQDPAQEPVHKQDAAQQTSPKYTSQDSSAAAERSAASTMTQKADGQRRRDLPVEAYAVAPGTKFLVKLEDDLSTASTREKTRFKVQTLEPLEAGSGIYLPTGEEISGHVSRVEPAGVAGRARLYLTFDDIHTRFGTLPIVANIAEVPGDKSMRVRPDHEGVVEGRTTTQQAVGQAAAAGAAMGAVHGVKDKNVKEAEEGALAGAIAAYLMESGRGHELELIKGAKLELELERALYLVKE